MTANRPLNLQIDRAPFPYDLNAVQMAKDVWGAQWASLSASEVELLTGVIGSSPYLRRLIESDPDGTVAILNSSPGDAQAQVLDAVGSLQQSNDAGFDRGVRQLKNRAALAVALYDLGTGSGPIVAAHDLSRFAEAAINAAFHVAADRRALSDGVAGIAVIAMGKLGAGELNYSSDIDLVVVYDAAAMGFADRALAKNAAVRVTKDAVGILNNQTKDGYVFRTDLRLRPDPGVSQLAVSIGAAEAYYESFGQNWERMAYIKARAIAGDLEVGQAFLKALRPFIWRKNLDYAAIDDVKAVKRQIHTAKGGHRIEFLGHDVKTGRGGIREIEFFAQTQQIILGGKVPALRKRGTIDTLSALVECGQLSTQHKDELIADYTYLRHVEHRLQMINDEQTHRMPRQQEQIDRLVAFLGEESADFFEERLRKSLERVAARYDGLFSEDTVELDQPGPLVFTGVDDDRATLQTLNDLGFSRSAHISETIRQWHRGSVRATRSDRARGKLTALMPPLLEALSRSSDPDAAFLAFDEFLKNLPAGVQLFSMLSHNSALFDDLISLIVVSPYLGQEMARRYHFIESLLEHGVAAELPALETYGESLADVLAQSQSYEDQLNLMRRWASEARFFVAAKSAVGVVSTAIAAAHYTSIAEACVSALLPLARAEMERQHGVIDGEVAIVAMGRLGAREMTYSSDLDITFIYEADPKALSTGVDGIRALYGTDYFVRLLRRFVTGLSVATEEGTLYEVDMSLRPSGASGPAAVQWSAFERYYARDAWTWEYMALTKARVIAGTPNLADRMAAEINEILRRRRDPNAVAKDVLAMRDRLTSAKPSTNPWDVKKVRGGLIEVDFLIEFLILVHASRLGPPEPGARSALDWLLHHRLLPDETVDLLTNAHQIFDIILHAFRTSTGGDLSAEAPGDALAERLTALCGKASIDEARDYLVTLQELVAKTYEEVLFRSTKDGG